MISEVRTNRMVKDQVGGGRRVLKMENGEDGGKILNMDKVDKEGKVDKEEEEVAEWREQIERAIRKVDIGQYFGFFISSCCFLSYLRIFFLRWTRGGSTA